MTESKWTAQLRRALEARGACCLKLHGHSMQAAGWPDLYVAARGCSRWVEVKARGGRQDVLQHAIMRQLRAAGVEAHVVTRTEDGGPRGGEALIVETAEGSSTRTTLGGYLRFLAGGEGALSPADG